MSGDDRSWNDGDKLSFSERDKLRRDGAHDSSVPQGVSRAQQQRSAQQYMKKLDDLFSASDAEMQELEAAVASAHGSPGLAAACRAYRATAGHPKTARLIGMFLDSDDSDLIAHTLEATLALCASGGFKSTAGLRSQVRMLIEGSDSQIAGLAEDLLEQL